MSASDDRFTGRNREMIRAMAESAELHEVSRRWFFAASRYEYSYHFTWLGLPIIQFPQDIVAMQEIIWRVRPDLIVETGVARGGSLVFYASMLELMGGDGVVAGVDVDIRPPTRQSLERHPLTRRIRLIEGSSTSHTVVDQVFALARGRPRVLVCLDSNHTRDHVKRELELYAPLVRKGSYLVVFDTIVEEMPRDLVAERPWGRGNSPATAVGEFLAGNPRFVADPELDAKLLVTVAPGGYLRCVAD